MYRILLVEDNDVIADSVCSYVRTWGYEAEKVQDFQNIMKQFIAYAPSLVLMDISLPFFNGYHWCSEIRKITKVAGSRVCLRYEDDVIPSCYR